MTWVAVILLVGMVAAGCGPTAQQQRSARLEALQLELDSVLETWKADVSRRRFATSADAAHALVSRYDTVYARWGLRSDPLTQATMAYTLALAARVDRQDLSVDDANALLGKMRGDVERARSVLAERHNESPAGREAAMIAWWTEYWTANQRTYQVTAQNPVQCETAPSRTTGSPIVCF
jgi:uncharacterized membrane-anchored protein YhcB (DUF1043 family)